MQNPEFIAHGSASSETVKTIKNEGFKFEEGRETVSGDFFLGMDFAQPREDTLVGSRNNNTISEQEPGSLIVLRAPEGYKVDYGTETSITVKNKRISGHVGKYSGGRKQLGIYRDDIKFLGVDIDEIKESDNPIVKASEELGDMDIEKKVEALKKVEIVLGAENIAAEIRATPEVTKVTNRLKEEVLSFSKTIAEAAKEIADVIEKQNHDSEEEIHSYSSREELENILNNLLKGSVENSIQERIRVLSLDIKMLQGYEIKDQDKIPNRTFNLPSKEAVEARLKVYTEAIKVDGFTTGIPKMDRYLSIYLPQLQGEFNKVQSS